MCSSDLFACGLGRVKLPGISLLLMGLASGSAVLFSMAAGNLVSNILTPTVSARSGGVILICFGLGLLWQLRGGEERGGLMGILTDPAKADLDSSGSISGREAVILGTALALDAFGAGFGAALAGYPPLATGAAAALAQVFFVRAGVELGRLAAGQTWVKKIQFLPSLILCVLGTVKLFFP